MTAKYCVPISGNPRLVDPARLGGALVDIGVYPIRYTYELFGMPKKIVCEGSVEGGVDHKEKHDPRAVVSCGAGSPPHGRRASAL